MECGCTGMEVEAFNLLQPLLEDQHYEVNTNKCDNLCKGYDANEVARLHKAATGKGDAQVAILHVAFKGVCGLKTDWPNNQRPPRVVARAMYEVDGLPPSAVGRCNSHHFDEVWVPSQFNKDTFIRAGVKPEKIHVVPEALDTAMWDPAKVQPYDLEARAGYNFLSVFKMEDRKNWKGLVEAFLTEFDADEDVKLYIKTRPCGWCGYSHPKQAALQFAGSLEERDEKPIPDARSRIGSQVVVMDEEVSMGDLTSIYRGADAFVLPSHGEGWGLTLMEAMAMALPTIGTRWSGNRAFMDDETSILVDVASMEVGFEQLKWAVPDRQMLQAAMRGLVLQPNAGKELGERARTRILEHFARAPVSSVVKERLDALYAAITPGAVALTPVQPPDTLPDTLPEASRQLPDAAIKLLDPKDAEDEGGKDVEGAEGDRVV